MENWIKQNWDKILTMLIAGIIGFFSAILAIRNDIGELKINLNNLKSNVSGVEKKLNSEITTKQLAEKIAKIDELKKIIDEKFQKIADLEKKLEGIELLSHRRGANQHIRINSSEFWNNIDTNNVGHVCENGSFLTGIRFDMKSVNGVRTPTNIDIYCASKSP